MQPATTFPSDVRRGISRSRLPHPAKDILYRKGITVAALAATLGEPRSSVAKWFGAGRMNRPIPRRYAERLKRQHGIPYTAWERIAD